jgi:short-subunit dehydrogenase
MATASSSSLGTTTGCTGWRKNWASSTKQESLFCLTICPTRMRRNAGMIVYGKFCETDWEDERRMLWVNLMSLTRLTKLILPGMRERGRGRILNVGSVVSFVPSPRNAVYSATKAYLLSLSEAIAEELQGSGVTVTAVCPGAVRSELQQRAGMTHVRLLRSGVLEASRVAEYAYRAMMAGKRLAIPDLRTQIQVFLVRFLPRAWAVRMAGRMLE